MKSTMPAAAGYTLNLAFPHFVFPGHVKFVRATSLILDPFVEERKINGVERADKSLKPSPLGNQAYPFSYGDLLPVSYKSNYHDPYHCPAPTLCSHTLTRVIMLCPPTNSIHLCLYQILSEHHHATMLPGSKR